MHGIIGACTLCIEAAEKSQAATHAAIGACTHQ